jgi:hypothetical protein
VHAHLRSHSQRTGVAQVLAAILIVLDSDKALVALEHAVDAALAGRTAPADLLVRVCLCIYIYICVCVFVCLFVFVFPSFCLSELDA